MEFLLDTNICIYIIKQRPVSVLQKFEQYAPGSIGISSITVAELFYGVHKSIQREKNLLALSQFLLPLEIVEFDFNAAVEYGKIRSEMEQAGTPIGSLDMLIAAQAKSLDIILVTNNEREFKRINGLKVENWVS